MPNVLVYRFRKYDVNSDEWQTSRRWATAEAIVKVGGEAVGDPLSVDESLLGGEVDGMTDRAFNPNSTLSTGGFQQTVKRSY